MTKRSNPRGSKGKFARCVKAVTKRGGARDPRAVCGAMEKKFRGNPTVIVSPNARRAGKWKVGPVGEPARYSNKTKAGAIAWAKRHVKEYGGEVKVIDNPAAQAIEAYEEFHGRKPDEYITVKRQVHVHRHLAGAGQLRKMKVQSVDGKRMVTLSRFGNALLAFNEKKNQLFVEGGSQSVDLKAFGVRTQHEVETLGKVVMLDYFTRKDHLGKDGGTAIYRHKFRTVNQDGRPVTVKILRYPDLIYFTLDKHLVFSGGDYEILSEGIDK